MEQPSRETHLREQRQEEQERSRSHTVTTTASSFTANLSSTSSTLAYDKEFLRTVPGILMVAEITWDCLEREKTLKILL